MSNAFAFLCINLQLCCTNNTTLQYKHTTKRSDNNYKLQRSISAVDLNSYNVQFVLHIKYFMELSLDLENC
jgi:hypothetical protein